MDQYDPLALWDRRCSLYLRAVRMGKVQQRNGLPLCGHPPRIRIPLAATRVSDATPVEQAEFRNRDVELVGE
jgi:hypothetical protein